MVLFQGSNRVFDKAIQEDSTSTSTARAITLYGVTSYNELTDVILSIKAVANGNASATLSINSLTATSIKYINDGAELDVPDNWIVLGQTYFVIYNGNNFILLNEIKTDESHIYDGSIALLDLTSSSTADEITEAFGSSEDITNFISAIYNQKVIRLVSDTGAEVRIALAQSSYEDSEAGTKSEAIQILMADDLVIKRLVFTRSSDATDAYTSVTVTDIPLSTSST